MQLRRIPFLVKLHGCSVCQLLLVPQNGHSSLKFYTLTQLACCSNHYSLFQINEKKLGSSFSPSFRVPKPLIFKNWLKVDKNTDVLS